MVKGRSPETNLLLDDSMLTYTLLLAIRCTDECFNYKSTHFELRLFIATIHCHEWNILFILRGADQTADNMQAIKKKKKEGEKFGVNLLVWQMVFKSQNDDTVVRVRERERERKDSVCNLLLHHAIMVSGDGGIPSAFYLDHLSFPGSCSGM